MIASPEPTVGLIAVVTILIGGDYMNVGIRELKAHLSDYVRRAERGEPILVTHRGKPVARLVGLGGVSAVDRGIARLDHSSLGRRVGTHRPMQGPPEHRRCTGRGSRVTLYVDTSALLKRYIAESDSDFAEQLIRSDPVLVTSRLTEVELRRNLTRCSPATTCFAPGNWYDPT